MLLRASGEQEERDYDLNSVTDSAGDPGLPHGAWLRALAEQAIAGDWQRLPDTLAAASREMGEQAAVDALVVAAAFNGITRVADATGIPLDENTAVVTVGMREGVGLDAFAYAEKSRRFG